MVEIRITYEGDLRCKAVHGPSSSSLSTDAPKDNNGRGQAFSPTDLVATALGTCMLTIMGIAARKMEVDIKGTTVTVMKEMVADPVRRIGMLSVRFNIPARLNPEQQLKLQEAALTCPVHKSLHPDVQIPIEFNWA